MEKSIKTQIEELKKLKGSQHSSKDKSEWSLNLSEEEDDDQEMHEENDGIGIQNLLKSLAQNRTSAADGN
jgi:hypothetical protein